MVVAQLVRCELTVELVFGICHVLVQLWQHKPLYVSSALQPTVLTMEMRVETCPENRRLSSMA
eukprot:3437465-Amphidinium_carterae.1